MSRHASHPVSPTGLRVLRYVQSEAAAGRGEAIRLNVLAAAMERSPRAMWGVLGTLERDGLVTRPPINGAVPRPPKLTEKGLAMIATLDRKPMVKQRRKSEAKAPVAQRPIAHTPDAAPLPPPALPALSASVATFRGLVHPLPPLAHARPKGFAGTTWSHATTLPSMQRRA